MNVYKACSNFSKIFSLENYILLLEHIINNNGKICRILPNQKIIIEYSSPNIAKSFHAGHLRSTIIGNFIANLHKNFAIPATKINYLGDWGFQLGLLMLGLQSDLKHNLNIDYLTQIYIDMNEKYNNNKHIQDQVYDILHKLDIKDCSILKLKMDIDQISLSEIKSIYENLDIHFDVYEKESQYIEESKRITDYLIANDIAKKMLDNSVTYHSNISKSSAILQKSDGSTLYLTRDVAAALHRLETYKPNHMIYVVESGQHLHFQTLFEILQYFPQSKDCKFTHLKFGRIAGMQTRLGTGVYVKDMIARGTELMVEKLKNTSTTNPNIKIDEVAKALAISSIIVNVLKEKRCKTYKFDWDRALDFKSDSGNYLQYTHARLYSLENAVPSDNSPNNNLDADVVADDLNNYTNEYRRVYESLVNFEEQCLEALNQYESSVFLNHLFTYCRAVNYAYKRLPIKTAPTPEIAQFRSLYFRSLRLVLHNHMRVVGLKPLNAI